MGYLFVVRRFAELGASVILATRSADRTKEALAQVKAAAKSGAKVEWIRLDLQDFASIRSFVTEFQSKYNKLDLLINNAG
jgi:retinol dehydrogenase-12